MTTNGIKSTAAGTFGTVREAEMVEVGVESDVSAV